MASGKYLAGCPIASIAILHHANSFQLFASIRLATVQSVTHMSDLQLWFASVKNAISDPQAASASFAVDRVYR